MYGQSQYYDKFVCRNSDFTALVGVIIKASEAYAMTSEHVRFSDFFKQQASELTMVEDEARMALEKVKLNTSKKQVMTQTIEQLTARVRELEAENARLKTVPMKYRRMTFNAQLQDENQELRAQLAAAQEECEFQRNAHKQAEELMLEQSNQLADAQEEMNDWRNKAHQSQSAFDRLQDQLAKAEQRVAEACALTYLEDYDLIDIAERVRAGEYRKFMKGEQ